MRRLMARRCSICSRPDVGAINELLGEGRAARAVAVERGVSEDAMQRHATNHLARPATRPVGTPATDPPAQDALDELVEALRGQALAGNPAIVHQYRLALAAQADAKHAAPPTRDLASEPEWITVRARLLRALEPFPEARLAVVAALGAD